MSDDSASLGPSMRLVPPKMSVGMSFSRIIQTPPSFIREAGLKHCDGHTATNQSPLRTHGLGIH
jgi:hypothetical protein